MPWPSGVDLAMHILRVGTEKSLVNFDGFIKQLREIQEEASASDEKGTE